MKRSLIGAALLILMLAIAIQWVVSRLSIENFRPLIEAQLGKALGLAVTIEGDLSIELLPELQIRAGALKVANLPGRASPYLLEVDRLELELQLRPLLRRTIAIDTLEIVEAELRVEPDKDGQWSLRPKLEAIDEPTPAPGTRDPLEMRLRSVVLRDFRVFYDRFESDHVTAVTFEELSVDTADLDSPVALAARGHFEGSGFSLEADLGSVHELTQPSKPFPIALRGDLLGTRLEARGTLDNPLGWEGIALRFEAEISDLATLRRDRDREPPPLGPLRVTGLLENPDGTLGIRDLSLRTASAGPIQLVLEGSVRDLIAVTGVDAKLHLEAEDAELFEAFAEVTLPHTPVHATVAISDGDGSLGLEGEIDTAGGPFDLDLRGALDDLRRLRDLDVQIALGSETLVILRDAFELPPEIPIPALGPVRAKAHLVDRDGRLGLDDIEIRVGSDAGVRAKISGAIQDGLNLRGLDLQVEAEAPSAREVAAFFGRVVPDVGSLHARATLADRDGTLGLEDVTLRVGTPGAFALTVRGGFDDLRDFDEIELEVELDSESLTTLGALAEIELPPVGPVAFRGRVRGSDERLTSSGRARFNRTEFNGDWTARFTPDERPSFTASLRSSEVFLSDIGIAPDLERPDLGPATPSLNWSRWRRGEQALDFGIFHEADLDLRFYVARVSGRELLKLENLRLGLALDDGRLTLHDVGAEYQGGKVAADLEINARTPSPTFLLRVEAFSVNLEQLASQFYSLPNQAGLLDVSIDLAASGATGPLFLDSLEGHFGGMLREGVLIGHYSRNFTLNFLQVSVPEFLLRQDREPPVRCLLGMFDVRDGVARAGDLYLEGDEITITGAGQIDFPQDEIDLRLTPHVHDPGLVSVAATVDVSGPIGSPNIRAVPRSLGVSAASALLRNALRPLRAARAIVGIGSRGLVDVQEPCNLIALQRNEHMKTAVVESIDVSSLRTDSANPPPP